MKLNQYPYAIAKLHNKIETEKSYLSKFFFCIDLYNSIIRYSLILSISCIQKENISTYTNKSIIVDREFKKWNKFLQKSVKDDRYLTFLKKIANNLVKLENLFIPELLVLNKKEIINTISNIEKVKSSEMEKSLKSESYYEKQFNKISKYILELLKNLSFLRKYNLVLPFSKSDEIFNYILLTGKKLFIEEISKKNIYDINLKNFYLLNKNNDLLEIKSELFGINTRYIQQISEEKNFNIEKLLNDTNSFLGGEYLKLNIDESVFEITEEEDYEQSIRKEVLIERKNIQNSINQFFIDKNSGYLFIVGICGIGKTTAIKSFINQSNKLTKTKNKTQESKQTNIYFSNVSKNSTLNSILNDIYKQFQKKYNVHLKTVNDKLTDFSHFLNFISEFGNREIIIFEDIDLLIQNWTFFRILPEKLPENIYIMISLSPWENINLPVLNDKEVYPLPAFSKEEINLLSNKILGNENKIELNKMERIEKNSNNIPVYVKIELFDLLRKSDYIKKTKSLSRRHFIELMRQIEKDKELNKLHNEFVIDFFGVIAISKEGYNKNELRQILHEIPEENIDQYLYLARNYLIKLDGRYKFISEFIRNVFVKFFLKKEEHVKELHNKIIEFSEPWDKKISSLTLKYLPYHYLKADRVKELEKLFESNFIKSKFKIYPNEVLNDLSELIKYISENEPHNIINLIRFSFIFQKYKELIKDNYSNIIEKCKEKKYFEAILYSEYLNKPMEKFYQLLLITNYISEENPQDAKDTAKKLNFIPDVYTNEFNSKLIFKIVGHIASNGVFDIINLPRSREDGINFIKNFEETPYSYKLIDVILNLINNLQSEFDKVLMLETLINRVSEFKVLNEVSEKFLLHVVFVIEKITSPNLRDKLYFTYISNLLRHGTLNKKYVPVLIALKDKVELPLFKFLYYGNLSLLFVSLKQDNLSYDFIFKSISFIDKVSSAYHTVVFSSISSGLKQFKNTYYYNELFETLLQVIEKISNNKEYIERSLNLLNETENNTFKKEIIKKTSKLVFELKEDEFFQVLGNFIFTLSTIKDGRIRTPIIKKLINYSQENNFNFKVKIFSKLIFNTVNIEKSINIENFRSLISTEENENKMADYYLIILDDISLSNEINLSNEFLEFILSEVNRFNNKENIAKIVLKVLNTLGRYQTFPKTKFYIDQILTISLSLDSRLDQLKIFMQISILLINKNEKTLSLQMLHKIFHILAKENDNERYYIISLFLKNLRGINYIFKEKDYLFDLLTNLFNFFQYFKNKEYILKIVSELFSNLDNLNLLGYLPELFYRVLEVTEKIQEGKIKDSIINLIRFYLHKIENKADLYNILQKTIIVSESAFKTTGLNYLSLASLAFLIQKENQLDLSKKILRNIIYDLNFLSYEEYISEVYCLISEYLSKFDDTENSSDLYKLLIDKDNVFDSDKYLNSTFNTISNNLTNTGNLDLILPVYESLLNKAIKIRNESTKIEYLTKSLSYITNFGYSKKTEKFIKKVFNLKSIINSEDGMANFYKSFLISLNKLNTKEIVSYIEIINNEVQSFQNKFLKGEVLSFVAMSLFKFKDRNEGIQIFNQIIGYSYEIADREKQFEYIGNLGIKLFVIGETNSALNLLDYSIEVFELLKNDKIKLDQLTKFIFKFTQLKTFGENKMFFYKFFEKFIKFSKENDRAKIYLLLAQTYHKLNEMEYKDIYFKKVDEIVENFNISQENIEFMFGYGMALLQSNDKNGNNILKKSLLMLKSAPKKFRSELIIKLFNSLNLLGDLSFDKDIVNDVLSLVNKLDLNSLSENEIYNISYTYVYINEIDKFLKLFDFVNNNILKEKIIRSTVQLLKDREETNVLIKLIPYTLENSKLLDYVLSNIILLINDSKKVNQIISENLYLN